MERPDTKLERYRVALFAHLNGYIDKTLPFGALVALLAVITTLFGGNPDPIPLFFNIATIALLALLFVFRKRLPPPVKVVAVTSFLALYGSFLLLFTKYETSGLLLVFMNVIMIIFLLSRLYQVLFIGITTLVIISGLIIRSYGDAGVLTVNVYSIDIYLALVFITAQLARAVYAFLFHKLDLLEIQVAKERETNAVLQNKNREIETLAYFDRFTGLYNRERFSSLLSDRLLETGTGTLLFLDIKQLQKINSLYGFKRGDAIIASFAGLLTQSLTGLGFAAYLGANRFVVYFARALGRVEFGRETGKFKDSLNRALDLTVPLDFYAACMPLQGEAKTFEEYYKLADTYLSRMKAAGDISTFVDGGEKLALLEKETREEYAIEAIAKKGYEIHYQEKYDVLENRIVGVEALARLWHPGGYIPPLEFIGTIEATDHIHDFGYLILEGVFSQIGRIREIYGDIGVSINISPKQMADAGFYDDLVALVGKHGIDPSRIELEITETVLMSNFDDLIDIIRSVKELGFKFSLDDFGTGYSSLNYLALLPIDVIKIDKSFVDKILTEKTARAIVKAVVDIAADFDLEIVAEGVERQEQLDALKALGCSVIQGFIFSKPKKLPPVASTGVQTSPGGAPEGE